MSQSWRVWLSASRPRTLVIGVAPVLVGSAMAWSYGAMDVGVLVLALLATMAMQVATNLYNDAEDFERGADAVRLGPARAAATGLLSPAALRRGTWIALGAALLFGAGLVMRGGVPILLAGIASMVAALAYTGGPWPLAYRGLGELLALVFFGLVAVVGTVYLHMGAVPPESWVAALALGFYAAAILALNNLRDHAGDAAVGKRTLAVRWGLANQRRLIAVCVCAPWLLTAIHAAITGHWSWLLPCLVAPATRSFLLGVYNADGGALNFWFGRLSELLTRFTVLLVAGSLA